MNRFFVPPERCRENLVLLPDDESHHARTVLRLRRNDSAVVLDGAGLELRCVVEEATGRRFALRVIERHLSPPSPCRMFLYQAVLKPKAQDWLLQKATELGAHSIAPILAARTVSHLGAEAVETRCAKWRQVLIEAAKQCGTPWVPQLQPPCPLDRALKTLKPPEICLVGSLEWGVADVRRVFAEHRAREGREPHTVGIWIGPEGDFTPEESAQLRSWGARPVSLGPRVLRSETAALCALALIDQEVRLIPQ